MNVWVLAGLGFDIAIALMVVVWFIARRLNNAGFVDAAWAYGFGVVTLVFMTAGGGYSLRKSLITAMVVFWSVRLGSLLLRRILKTHPQEDERYIELRAQFPKRPWFMFFGFFQLQAFLIGLLSIPFAIICANPTPNLHPMEIIALALWMIAQGGEVLADNELHSFRQRPENQGRVCDRGLWRYSRHPNYFCEWLTWVAFFLFAAASPGGWITIYCPLLMLYFLTKVTGIPPTEAHALKSRGDAYRDYQHRTHSFFPWFPKKYSRENI